MKVAANLLAVLDAVAPRLRRRSAQAEAREAMRGPMSGYYEVRATGPGRDQFGCSACSITPLKTSSLAGDSTDRQSQSSPASASHGGRRSTSATTRPSEASATTTSRTTHDGSAE